MPQASDSPGTGVTGACELLNVGVLGTEFQSSGKVVCTIDPWATFSVSVFSVCVCVWVCATGVQVPAEAGERVRSSGVRVKTAVSCLALLLGTELGPLKSSNYSNCWVLSPATPPYIDFFFFLEPGSQVAQTSLLFTVCLRTLNFWASYLYFPSAVTTGMHPHFVRSALHQLSYMTHPQSLLLHSIIAFCMIP